MSKTNRLVANSLMFAEGCSYKYANFARLYTRRLLRDCEKRTYKIKGIYTGRILQSNGHGSCFCYSSWRIVLWEYATVDFTYMQILCGFNTTTLRDCVRKPKKLRVFTQAGATFVGTPEDSCFVYPTVDYILNAPPTRYHISVRSLHRFIVTLKSVFPFFK